MLVIVSVINLRKLSDSLTAANSQYLDFAQQVRQLADSCQQDRLEQLFKALIES